AVAGVPRLADVRPGRRRAQAPGVAAGEHAVGAQLTDEVVDVTDERTGVVPLALVVDEVRDGAATEVLVRHAGVDVAAPHGLPRVGHGALDERGRLDGLPGAVRVGHGGRRGVLVYPVVGVPRAGLGGRGAVPEVPVPRDATGAGAVELHGER